jgi:uncharacterized protein HemY
MSTHQAENNNHRIGQITELLHANPNDCFLLHALALEHVKLEEYLLARDYFEQVLRTDKAYVGTYYHLAKLHERLKNKAAAIDTYNTGITMAVSQRNTHAASELRSALEILTEDDD